MATSVTKIQKDLQMFVLIRYTSIGGVNDTVPNPTLYDPEAKTHKQAYHLHEDALERIGRQKKNKE